MELTFPRGTQARIKDLSWAILLELQQRGDIVDSKNATGELATRLGERNIHVLQLRTRLEWLENLNYLCLDSAATSTRAIMLNSDLVLPAGRPLCWNELAPEDPPAPEPEQEPLDPQVALDLIMQLAGYVVNNWPAISDEVTKMRLADALAGNERLRSKVSTLEDQHRADTQIISGLRREVRTLEMNLDALRGTKINDSGAIAIRNLMKAPSSTKGA